MIFTKQTSLAGIMMVDSDIVGMMYDKSKYLQWDERYAVAVADNYCIQ